MRSSIAGLTAAILLSLAGCSSSQETRSDAGLPENARYLADDPSCAAPRCFELDIPVPGDVHITDNRVRVLVPADYATSGKRYPLLYLLHDAPGDYTSWTRRGDAQALTENLDVIAIMPDGGGGNPGWYTNWHSGEFQWETYHLDVMMPYVEQQLRVLGDGHRAVAGPSMGGHGSMYYSALRPGLFQAAGGISGAVDFLVLDRGSALAASLLSMPAGPVWGDPVTNFPMWQAHDPGTHIDGLAGMRIYLSSGNGLPGGPHDELGSPQLYAIEPLLYVMNLSFAAALSRAGIEHETFFYGPGFHDWPYYRDAFAWMLPKLLAAIEP
jgi:diacylglycerol O-acyltransferase/trehalose O-mycolyltransferase